MCPHACRDVNPHWVEFAYSDIQFITVEEKIAFLHLIFK